MSPTAKKALLVLAGAVLAALPAAFPALAPFASYFTHAAVALGVGGPFVNVKAGDK